MSQQTESSKTHLYSVEQAPSTTIGYDLNVVANHERRIGTTCFACMAWM
jgi:hypothetical protein